MQAWDLQRKIQVTQTRIIEWYQHFDGQVYISFSGGKDSTVLLDMARRIYGDIPALFIDTGLEYPEIKTFVKTFENIDIRKPEMNFKDVIEKYGYPIISKEVSECVSQAKLALITGKYQYRLERINGTQKDKEGNLSSYNMPKWKFLMDAPFEISHMCCNVMKKKPAHKYEKETKRHPIIGTMAVESRLRLSHWKQTGCNGFEMKKPTSNPMSFWTEQDVLLYLKMFNIPYASVYGEIIEENEKLTTSKCKRTGCIFCGFGCHLEHEPNRFQMLEITHPKQHDFCIRPVDEKGLGMGEVLDFIGVKYKNDKSCEIIEFPSQSEEFDKSASENGAIGWFQSQKLQ